MCNKGVIIFSPNYRGSTGRGQWFRELNFDNLGVGDLWDIESGIDYLVEQGFIDESRIGSMGGSQGGYISAFAGMHSDRFRAVSVGSCAASWYTYYITSDLRDSILLAGEPFSKERDVSIKKTAPISAIKKANTPMLLQHGANDQRTGVANANELFRALKHKGVHTEFFMYNDAGHGYNSPRNFYALMLQNFRWFSHYLLDEELDFFKNDY
jgi:dipeptidyl aminopeptidase/acylaminoacyl peptidase